MVSGTGNAQLCQSPTDTIYGLNSITGSGSGQIAGVQIVNGGTSLIGSPAASSANANGLGFSSATQKFYFFNQVGSGATEFVSFNPLTGTKTTLAKPSAPALPTSSTGKIRSGTVNAAGDAYYTIFPGATTALGYPITGPAFYYYNIPGNTWVRITQTFKDISGNTVAEIKNLNSGDMAFDGLGRLWMVCSNSTSYAMYRIAAPLPTTAVASITVDTIIPSTPTPAGVSITGVAFNSAGSLYLTSGSGAGAGNNQLYQMTSPYAPLVNIATLPNGLGDDLSSCIYPFSVLPISYFQFSLNFNDNAVKLIWKADEADNVVGYDIEYSNDSKSWQKIASEFRNGESQSIPYSYTDLKYQSGDNYYRIAQVLNTGEKKYSTIRNIRINNNNKINIRTNLVNNTIEIYSKYLTSKYVAQIFDMTGRLVFAGTPSQTNQSIDISNLLKGLYIIKFSGSNQNADLGTYKFIKE